MSAGSIKGVGLVSILGYTGCNPGPECPVALEMWMPVQHSSGQSGKLSSLQNRMSVNSSNRRVKDVGSISELPEEPSWRNFTSFFVSSEFSCWLAGSR